MRLGKITAIYSILLIHFVAMTPSCCFVCPSCLTLFVCAFLKIRSIAVYGGAGVAEQIADLKRGAHIVTATPGRLIDILTMQSGKILSLHRVTYVVMDEGT